MARAGYYAWVDAPALMGLGNDPDKLVVIADAAEAGTNAVAFWRDALGVRAKARHEIVSYRQPDADRLGRLAIELSPNVLGYGVTLINSTYPKPLPAGHGNAFTGCITRPAPLGIEKSTWNPDKDAFEKA